MTCPVCQYHEIQPVATSCPSCGADLAPFVMLEEAEQGYVQLLKNKIQLEGELLQLRKSAEQNDAKKRRRYNTLLFLLFLIPFITYVIGKKQAPPVQQLIHKECDSITYYRTHYEAIRATQIRQLRYVVKEGDILEDLGLLFFNNKQAGIQIGVDNQINTEKQQHRLIPGDTLQINFR